MSKGVKKLLIALLTSGICVFSFIFFGGKVWAETGPISAENKVSLRVVDNINPSIPVLIAPTNNAYVTTGTPTFVWTEATDDRGISKYQIYLNGSLYYDNLPTGSSETANYIYTHDSINDQYSLKLKNNLTDGTYTWKIRVYDINGNSSESATWTFILDTLAPNFVISNVGEVAITVSAQDPSTVPASPIALNNNEPLIVATGEAGSTVVMTLTAPGDPVQTYTTTVDSNGNWSIQLGVFTRGDVITLDFVITDQAGLVSIISNLQFVISEIIIIFPPTPTPTPSVSPSPEATPGASITPTPSPSGTPAPPLIEIEVVPPREVIISFFDELGQNLPDSVKVLISLIPQELVQTLTNLAPISAAIVAVGLPAAGAAAVGAGFGGNLSLQLLLRILQSLGLLPTGKPQGIVFNAETAEPVPFALITIYSESSNAVQMTETVVTDVHGVYRGVKLAPGMYRMVVSHQDFNFPSAKKRPPYVQFKDFYLGEVFDVTSEKQQQLFLIPVDPKQGESKGRSFSSLLRLLATSFGRLIGHLRIPLFILSGLILIVFPSILNALVFLVYLILVAGMLFGSFKQPIITGQVVSDQKVPLSGAVIRIIEPESNELISVITTGKNGKFKVYADKGLYHFEVVLPGYIWREKGASMSFYQVDATKTTQDLIVVLEDAAKIYAELFT